ncbi:MAG: PEP-CTERM sorting domain-containing protein [Opitutae bacterium]|nr:PEP-CTERM sorting domain-containing protein [Opitutae bacterium]
MTAPAFRLLALFFSFAAIASAQTTVGLWKLGEDDSSPANGGPVASSVANSGALGGFTASGTPTYTNSTVGGSAWAIDMGSSGNSNSLALASTLGVNDNYAIEAWIYVANTSGIQVIFYNGDTSTNGMGLLVNGGNLDMMIGGVTASSNSLPTAPITLNTWVNVAAVRENGATYFFYDGIQYGAGVGTHGTTTGSFFLGSGGGYGFSGAIDNVRAFTFTGGTFSSSMLTAIPEPSAYAALAGLGALGLAFWRRKRAAA